MRRETSTETTSLSRDSDNTVVQWHRSREMRASPYNAHTLCSTPLRRGGKHIHTHARCAGGSPMFCCAAITVALSGTPFCHVPIVRLAQACHDHALLQDSGLCTPAESPRSALMWDTLIVRSPLLEVSRAALMKRFQYVRHESC